MRPLLALLLCQVACTPDDGLLPAEEDGTAFLDLQPDTSFATRAILVGDAGEAQLTPDGPALPEGPYVLPDRELVVVDAAEQVRVSWSNHTLQLLLWLDRLQLDDVVAATTVGTTRYADGDGQVQWPAGLPVELMEAGADRVLIGADLDGLRVESWVPAGDVDQVWDDDTWAPVPDTDQDLWVFGEVLDAPRGAPLAWPIDERVSMAADGDPIDGYHPVRWVYDSVEVQGWVHEDDLEPRLVKVMYGLCGGCYGHGMMGYGGPTNVPAETPVRSAPDGPVVGQTLRPLSVDFSRGTGWGTLQAATPWGLATVVVEEPL